MASRVPRAGTRASEQQLLKQLAGAPVVDVTGIPTESGVGAGLTQGEALWTLLFGFAVWRIAGGPLRTEELTVRRKVREKEIDKFDELIRPGVVTRIRARVVEDSVFGRPEGLLVKVLGPDGSDAELNAAADRLRQPVRIKDKTFGTLTLNRRVDWFEGRATWNGKKVGLSLSAREPADVERALQVARTLWRAQKTWGAKVAAYAARQLLSLKNDNWLETGERPLTAKRFRERMKLESITVSPDGSFEFWHDDGGLFFGHSIQISGSLAKGLYDADIPG